MNIYDLMTDDLGKVKEFEAACEDMLNSRYILADSKIIRILQTVALSTVLQSIIGGALKGFDYAATAREWGNGKMKMPSTEKDHVALVFCVLADLDGHKINFNDFLKSFFWNGDINMAYATFCSSMVAPFKRYVVGALAQAHGGPQNQDTVPPEITEPKVASFDVGNETITKHEEPAAKTYEEPFKLSPEEQAFKTDDIYEEPAFRLPPEEPTFNVANNYEEPTFRLPPEEPTFNVTNNYEEPAFRLPPEEPTFNVANNYEEPAFRLPPDEPTFNVANNYEEPAFRLPPEEPTFNVANNYEEPAFRLPPDEQTYQGGSVSSFDRKINNLAEAIERYLYESREIKDEYIFECDKIASLARTDRMGALQYAQYLKNLLGHVPEITPYITDVIEELM